MVEEKCVLEKLSAVTQASQATVVKFTPSLDRAGTKHLF